MFHTLPQRSKSKFERIILFSFLQVKHFIHITRFIPLQSTMWGPEITVPRGPGGC
jgi:hypothetical protein